MVIHYQATAILHRIYNPIYTLQPHQRIRDYRPPRQRARLERSHEVLKANPRPRIRSLSTSQRSLGIASEDGVMTRKPPKACPR
jgi:hypothetical protein